LAENEPYCTFTPFCSPYSAVVVDIKSKINKLGDKRESLFFLSIS